MSLQKQTKSPLGGVLTVGTSGMPIAHGVGYSPIVPKTTHGNVFPIMNSRILVISSKRPPRKMMGPLDWLFKCLTVIFGKSYMKATPFPLAPLHAIKQHDRGVVVMTNPPSAL